MPKEYHVNPDQDIIDLAEINKKESAIDPKLYVHYDVKAGLRDLKGTGVLAGLTRVSDVMGFKVENGVKVPCEGKLYYRGINIKKLTKSFQDEQRFGFEETTYLLLFGHLPTEEQLTKFKQILIKYRSLPKNFVRDVIMKAPSENVMNTIARSVLMLYAYDSRAEDTSLENVLRQCLMLIMVMPMFAIYGYQAYRHYLRDDSLIIHNPDDNLSFAENILRMLRPDMNYLPVEARVLDMALILHMEHGGGNNSTFTTRVVTSSGTDTYSAIAASLGSLKGPKHGGANIKVVRMINDLKAHVSNWKDKDAVYDYLKKILRKEAFDKSGLIYGMGHAVYSLSDPRAKIFKKCAADLAAAKGMEDEYNLYLLVEELAADAIREERQIYKGVSANVDFFSGFAYSMLGIPEELFTPMFACARMVGWSAHRMEELINGKKIIRPAYLNVQKKEAYVPLKERG